MKDVMKSSAFRQILPLLLAALTVSYATLTSAANPEPEMRKWTSRAGSQIEAVLVDYTDSTIKLRFANGSEKEIPTAQLSDADIDYAKTFPKLKKEVAPWVSLSAKTGAAGRSRSFGVTKQKKALDIEVENKASESAEIDLIWLMLGKDLETDEQVVVDFGMWKGELGARESKDLRTPESTTSFADRGRYYSYYGGYYYYSSYYYPSGSEITSFIVQARWKDQVLASATGASAQRIKDAAAAKDLISGLTEAGFKVDSGLATQIRKGLSAKPEKE